MIESATWGDKVIKTKSQKRESVLALLLLIPCAYLLYTAASPSPATSIRAGATTRTFPGSTNSKTDLFGTTQFDDPYGDFRDARYSNDGLLSESEEIKLGARIHQEVVKKYKLTTVGLDRVERIGQRVARASRRPNLVYTFHVLENKEINGFSIPGGHVYITTALLKLANENELASVLAHEVGHVAARHSLKTLKKSQEYNGIAEALGSITGIAGDTARDLGVALARIVAQGFLTIHTREEEREADFLGVRAMPGAGFDPEAMITMFQKLRRISDPGLLGSFFSDHPDVQERIDNTRYEINRIRRAPSTKG